MSIHVSGPTVSAAIPTEPGELPDGWLPSRPSFKSSHFRRPDTLPGISRRFHPAGSVPATDLHRIFWRQRGALEYTGPESDGEHDDEQLLGTIWMPSQAPAAPRPCLPDNWGKVTFVSSVLEHGPWRTARSAPEVKCTAGRFPNTLHATALSMSRRRWIACLQRSMSLWTASGPLPPVTR